MFFHPEQSRSSKRRPAFAVLFFSFVLAGCSVDAVALASIAGNAVQIHTGSIVGCAAAGAGIFMAASHVSPAVQHVAMTIALALGAFFVGNSSPQLFPPGLTHDGRLFRDIPNVLVMTSLFVAGLLAVINNLFKSGKSDGIVDEVFNRPEDGRSDHRAANHSAVIRETFPTPVEGLEFPQDALLVIDADEVIVELNREAEIMFGWTRAHLVGRPVEVLIPDSRLAKNPGQSRPFTRYSTAWPGALTRRKLRGVRKSGESFAVEVSVCCGRSSGPFTVIATIRTATEPSQANTAPQRGKFACNHAARVTRPNQSEEQRQAFYVGMKRRLTGVMDASEQVLKTSASGPLTSDARADMRASFELPEGRIDNTSVDTTNDTANNNADDFADSQWAARWANAENSARASAFSLLRVIDDLHKFPVIDGPEQGLVCSPTASTQRIENLCDRLFPTSRIVAG